MFNITYHQGKANQTTMKYYLTPVRWLPSQRQKKKKMTNVGEDAEKG